MKPELNVVGDLIVTLLGCEHGIGRAEQWYPSLAAKHVRRSATIAKVWN